MKNNTDTYVPLDAFMKEVALDVLFNTNREGSVRYHKGHKELFLQGKWRSERDMV
jgi:hypothetical protein